MSYARTNDWRRLPAETREQLLAVLQQRAQVVSGSYLNPVELAGAVGIVPDPWQADLLRSTDKQLILNCSRQSGKSTVAALLGLHQCLFVSGSLVLLLAPSQRQSQELFRTLKESYERLTEVTELTQESALRLEFANQSRVVVLPGREATLRGFSGVDLLVIDEASRVPDALYQSCRPMLAVSGGRIILLSTPCGSRGFFYSEFTEGGDDWRRVLVPASMCPRIPADWLQRERERIGSYWASQEYDCQFRDNEDQIFATDDIMRAISSEVRPLWTM
jgi:hypothetical protein